MAPLISVIIPAYNADKFLAEAIASILEQAYSPLEILVVDDGSDDRTGAIAREFGDPVQYHVKPHGGAGSARNHGMNNARGEWIAFLDADDLWAADKLSLQLEALRANPALEAVFGQVQNFTGPSTPEQRLVRGAALPGHLPGAMLIHRQALQRIGNFSLQPGETVDFFIRARENNLKELMLPNIVLYRRIHENNLTSVLGSDRVGYTRILKAALDRKRGKTSP